MLNSFMKLALVLSKRYFNFYWFWTFVFLGLFRSPPTLVERQVLVLRGAVIGRTWCPRRYVMYSASSCINGAADEASRPKRNRCHVPNEIQSIIRLLLLGKSEYTKINWYCYCLIITGWYKSAVKVKTSILLLDFVFFLFSF